MLDFILKRIFPKWGPTRRIYTLLTRGNNRALSITETLGRLSVLGFNIEEYTEVGNLTFFVVRKIAPIVLNSEPSYGAIIRLRRVGKDGKLFNVFKIRTMHPYAEYLQGYVNIRNQLDKGGKFTDDFRITSWGRWLRKFWLDETPMWYNWLRGDLKLIGVRPLSEQYFALYPEEFQKRRVNYTPGLIPPFYVDLPETLDEIVESERKYLDAYDAHPWLTDLRYFWKSVYNIVVKGARSK
jgi:lipopolysaccharide/colanic/teichoic acid biosynthesis glycosyltransferase